MTEKSTLHEVILGYRAMIDQRYQYERIEEKYDIPASFDENRVALFRNYFLTYIYPPPAQRDELDAAFESLDSYIQQPEKLLRLLLDSAGLIFKYGRHLPKILAAGLKALRSFRTASRFEANLVKAAEQSDLKAPYSPDDIHTLLSTLSRREIEQFIEQSETLLATLHDRKLVQKIVEIVQYLINKMKQRPKLFSAAEIRGLEIGFDVIREGNVLFDQLSKEDQNQIFDFVIQIERDILEVLFEEA